MVIQKDREQFFSQGNDTIMIPLYKPYMPELPELESILYSGQLAYGKYARKFEEKLKTYFDESYLLVINSFHMAICVTIGALEISRENEIIASPMACLASTQPYHSYGLEIRWADIDSTTGTLNPESVRKRITPRTKAIVHNHFCGYPGYIDEINAIGKEYGIPVIDDGIECFGAEYKGKKIGHCGTDATVFSLNPVRIPNCIDGGIVIFKDAEVYQRALLVRDCGIERSNFRDNIGEINSACDIKLTGYSATMSEVNGYIGCQQMERVDALLTKHRENAMRWGKALDEEKGIISTMKTEGIPNYWVYGVLSDNKREDILQFRGKGYHASGVHYPNSRYSVFGKQDIELRGAEEFYRRFFALPCGWWMSDEI